MALLEGKIALITGASRGIGKSIAQRFVQEGATVAFTYRSSDEKARALEEELPASGGTARGCDFGRSWSAQLFGKRAAPILAMRTVNI